MKTLQPKLASVKQLANVPHFASHAELQRTLARGPRLKFATSIPIQAPGMTDEDKESAKEQVRAFLAEGMIVAFVFQEHLGANGAEYFVYYP